ncbi:MAG: hypothetical protein A3J48_01575 [Candidatus Doudnabacteria bacterium RIFCSPHIGHO2_02_FULL_46_11]|uniref:methionine adenosyltransferase n=1 Tax=Candidatus Doudnabacteria bacterium RIFCSPHIGHO2_02_FULL_46_11 TaxID=1817832 RepID=A0A1F5P9N2_9BACT|nr:MAG: hypothetical protein A3J48_01575 [Candidatus Doudnabacteria bacterium RIFCSPHIGHO2_02_FULL_46_11]
MIKTAEFVSPKHPDKTCDYIADTILDAFLKKDRQSRVAVEVMGGHGLITVNGEVTSRARFKLEPIVKKIVGAKYRVIVRLAHQSPEIAKGVDTGGAGDQGIMEGYATSESANFMPLEYNLARYICQRIFKKHPHDGKVQVTIEGNPPAGRTGRVLTVVASFQSTKTPELLKLVKSIIKADEYLINPAGEWHMGGFDADSGLSGRKLVVDNYGPEISIGGGSFSGKDYTKVDRSGAYMARKIAVDYLRKFRAKEVKIKLAYAIGKKDPVMAEAVIDGRRMPVEGYDLSPTGIRELLKLDKAQFVKTSQWGHFGNDFLWDK